MSTVRQPIQIQASALDHFASQVADAGGNGAAILRSVGIDPCVLEQPEVLIPLEAYRNALALAARQTGDDAFGVRLGTAQSFERLGLLGYMLRSAPTVGHMLSDAVDFLRVHNPGEKMWMKVDEDVALVSLIPRHIGRATLAQDLALGQALLTKCLRATMGPDWSPHAVYFQETMPERADTYRQTFRCPVHFDQILTATEFPASDLERPLRTHDARQYRLFRQYLYDLDNLQSKDIVALLRTSIQDMLAQRRPTLEAVAQAMDMSPGMLQRRLKEAGVTFQDEVAQLRISVAKSYLAETDEPLSVIADTLGFAEPAVFSRAFRRATGASPSEWRKAKTTRATR